MLNKETQKLADLVKDVKVAMLTTLDVSGEMRSRPMITTEITENDTIYFFTQAPTPKTEEIVVNHKLNVAYLDKDDNIYVSVSGHGSLMKDKELIEKLWKPVLKAYFPKGKGDPSLQLLCVKVSHAEYYNIKGNKMEQLIGMER